MNKLEAIGKILSVAFGDRVVIGILIGALDGVSPGRCYQYIKDGMQLFYWATDDDWQKYRSLAKQTKLNPDDLTKERVIEELRKSRPDLLGVIINTEGGDDWLNQQITDMKKKFEIG